MNNPTPKNFDVEAMRSALDALQPSAKRQRQELFSELLPAIKGAMDRKAPQKQILGVLKISPAEFKQLCATAEQQLRAVPGEGTCGKAGGSVPPPPSAGELARPESSDQGSQLDSDTQTTA